MSSYARIRGRVALGLVLGGLLVGCADPGCIRHSECGHGFICVRAYCVTEPKDGSTEFPDDDDAGR